MDQETKVIKELGAVLRRCSKMRLRGKIVTVNSPPPTQAIGFEVTGKTPTQTRNAFS
jgi:hypothetical protein